MCAGVHIVCTVSIAQCSDMVELCDDNKEKTAEYDT